MGKKRSYDASDIIALPRLGANSGTVLGNQLLTRANLKLAEAGGLPEDIAEARDFLEESVNGLHAAQVPVAPEDTAAGQEADQGENNAWRAYEKWLGGFRELYLAGDARYEKANALYELLFYNGLAFTQVAYMTQWEETQKRLDAIVQSGYESLISELGGTPFYEALQAAHVRYGEVLGITAKVDEPQSPEVRDRLLELIQATKEYVLQVAAAKRRSKPDSGQFVQDLLSPLINWSDQPTGSTTSDETAEGSTGESGGATTSEATGGASGGTTGGTTDGTSGESAASGTSSPETP